MEKDQETGGAREPARHASCETLSPSRLGELRLLRDMLHSTSSNGDTGDTRAKSSNLSWAVHRQGHGDRTRSSNTMRLGGNQVVMMRFRSRLRNALE